MHDEALTELKAIPARERKAIANAIMKLEALGPDLGYPHSSAVKGADRLRELRPRSGDSPWRAFYRQVGGTIFIVAAVGPEANVKPRDFDKAIRLAEERLEALEEEE